MHCLPGLPGDGKPIAVGGDGSLAYADALAVYLTFVMSRALHHGSSLCSWLIKDAAIRQVFSKQAFQMTWDFAEGSMFGSSSAEWTQCCKVVANAIEKLPAKGTGNVDMADAAVGAHCGDGLVISTDPPYYDNVPLRGSLRLFLRLAPSVAAACFPGALHYACCTEG